MSTFRRGATAAMAAGAAGLALCAQTLPAHAAPIKTAPAARPAAAALTQNQASNLALRILGDNLRSDAAVLSRVAGDHTAAITTDDGAAQQSASISATWAQKGTADRPCTDENVCTATKLAGGTLYTYNLLDNGYSYTYLRNDGGVVKLSDLDGQMWWEPSGYIPVDDSQIATLLQDRRWSRVLGATGSYVTPTKPNPPTTGKEAPTALAQRILTRNLAPEARIVSRTITANSVTLTTDGGALTGGYVKAEWMTRGIGQGQYDFRRDCYSKFSIPDRPATETSFGTGLLCEQDDEGMYGGPKHDWYYSRGDGKVLHISILNGAYKGSYSHWAPIPAATVNTMLTDPDWDVVLRKLVVPTPTPQQQALATAVNTLESVVPFDQDVTGITSDAATRTVGISTDTDTDRLTATWMKVGSGTGQFDEQRDCLSHSGGAENKATTVKLECSYTDTSNDSTVYYISHDWAGQDQPGTAVRITVPANSPLSSGELEELFQNTGWDKVTATL